ncbi:MAG: hypothetical protein ABIG71_00670 [Candidatus Uhrbacteria bacterium]
MEQGTENNGQGMGWILWGCDPVQWSDGIATLGYASLAMTLVVWLRTDD